MDDMIEIHKSGDRRLRIYVCTVVENYSGEMEVKRISPDSHRGDCLCGVMHNMEIVSAV